MAQAQQVQGHVMSAHLYNLLKQEREVWHPCTWNSINHRWQWTYQPTDRYVSFGEDNHLEFANKRGEKVTFCLMGEVK